MSLNHKAHKVLMLKIVNDYKREILFNTFVADFLILINFNFR
jgi:hypothetical protein